MHPEKQRYDAIDGLRCVAVLSVLAHHYYYRFGPPVHQPGLYRYDTVQFFEHGSFGVLLFFAISGFVIFATLEQSDGIITFLARRYFRLLPAMVACALLTYFFLRAHGTRAMIFQQESPLNLLFSFTFIHPALWNLVLGRSDIAFVDGAYWSLWTEVVFYVAAAFVYFSFVKKDFLRKWLIVVLVLQIVRAVASPRITSMLPPFAAELLDPVYELYLFLDLSYWIYFTAGIFFFSLFKRRKHGPFEWAAALILVALQLYYTKNNEVRFLFVTLMLVFAIIVYRPHWVAFLKWRPLVIIGLISYPLYLIHENVGVVLTNDLGSLAGHAWIQGFIPLLTTAILILFCYLLFVYYEQPAIRYLRSKFLPES
jgi:peptidoglycan/LPS O-acetylase OafA/YrhL